METKPNGLIPWRRITALPKSGVLHLVTALAKSGVSWKWVILLWDMYVCNHFTVTMEIWIRSSQWVWYACDVTKMVATQLPVKNKSKICCRAMPDKCCFCAEWCFTAFIWDGFILAHTDCKEMDLCPIGVFFPKKSLPFLTNRSPCGSAIKKGHSDRTRRVVHLSLCCMFFASSQFRARNSVAIFIFFSYRLPAAHGNYIIMPLTIIIFPQVRYNNYIILTYYSS